MNTDARYALIAGLAFGLMLAIMLLGPPESDEELEEEE